MCMCILNLLDLLGSLNLFQNSLLVFLFMNWICSLRSFMELHTIEIGRCYNIIHSHNKYSTNFHFLHKPIFPSKDGRMRRRAWLSVEEDFNFEKCGGWGLEGDVSCQNGREYKPIQFKLSTLLFIFPRRLMVNSSKKRTKHAPHSFHITGIPGKFIKEDVEVSFKPLPKKKIDKPRSIRPTFNHDRKFYTLAFRLPSAEVDPDEQALKEHERRVMEAQLEIEDIMYPKPRSKQKYCGVCKDYYEDYKEHVQSEPHITNLRRSPYQRLIKQTAQKLAEQVCDRRFEEEKTLDSTSEDQLFKCLSIETITEPTLTNKRTPEVAAE